MNKFEQQIDRELNHWTEQAAIIYTFEGDHIHYVRLEPERTYTPDFTIVRSNGSTLYVETKGYFRAIHRKKMRDVKRCNPDLDIRIVFQKNLVINKKSGFDYIQWAEKNGFPCAIGTIPKEWLE